MHAFCFPAVDHAKHVAAFAFLKTLQESGMDGQSSYEHCSTVKILRKSVLPVLSETQKKFHVQDFS